MGFFFLGQDRLLRVLNCILVTRENRGRGSNFGRRGGLALAHTAFAGGEAAAAVRTGRAAIPSVMVTFCTCIFAGMVERTAAFAGYRKDGLSRGVF